MSASDAKEVSKNEVEEQPTADSTTPAAVEEKEAEESTADSTSSAKEEKTQSVSISELMRRCNIDMGSWAEMTEEDEKEENKRREESIHAAIANFPEPFLIFVSNLVDYVVPEDVFLLFGGTDKVHHLFFCSAPNAPTAEFLVELKSRNALADALMLSKTEMYKQKVEVQYVDLGQARCYSIPQTAAEAAVQPPIPQESVGRNSYVNSNYGNDHGGKARGQRRVQTQPSNSSSTRNYKSSSNDVRNLPSETAARVPSRSTYASGSNAYPQHSQGGAYPQHSQGGAYPQHGQAGAYRQRPNYDDRYRNDYRNQPLNNGPTPPSLFDSRNEHQLPPPPPVQEPRKPPAEKPSHQSIFGQAKPVDTHTAQMALWRRAENEKKGSQQPPATEQPQKPPTPQPKEQPNNQWVAPPPPAEPAKLLTRKGTIAMKESPDEKPKDPVVKRGRYQTTTRPEHQHRRIDTGTVQKLLHGASKSNSSLKEVGVKSVENPNSQFVPKPPRQFRSNRKVSTQSSAPVKDERTPQAEVKSGPVEAIKQTSEVISPPAENAQPPKSDEPPSADPSVAGPNTDNGAAAAKAKKAKSNKKKKEGAVGQNRFGALANCLMDE